MLELALLNLINAPKNIQDIYNQLYKQKNQVKQRQQQYQLIYQKSNTKMEGLL